MEHSHEQAFAGHAHPKPALFWKVGVWLTILTAVEVAVFYIEALSSVLAPVLIVLSLGKFVLVAAYYMHLKFDARTYTGFFTFGFVVALIVYLAMIWMSGPAQAANVI